MRITRPLAAALAVAVVLLARPATVTAQADFAGCGELVQGVECILFQADSGGLYILENRAGFNVGDRVAVAGTLVINCISTCQQGDGCIRQNTIAPCPDPMFRACGELFEGVECVLFRADDGREFILDNLGTFIPGDRVAVAGVLEPNCASFCMQGDGCILNNLIGECPFALRFEGCGELVQGVECLLFRTDAGVLLVIENTGTFNAGDRVHVVGDIDPFCVTLCLEGAACIVDNTIGGCDRCPCDLVGDAGTVNVLDLLAYLGLWFQQRPAAECDGQDGIAVFDLLCFLDCWFPANLGEPCP